MGTDMTPQNRLRIRPGNMDGGISWIVVFGSFLQQFTVMGVHNVFGLLYIDLLDEFKEGKAATAWVASLSFSLTFMLGPLTTSLCTKFGIRTAAVIGAILFALGLLCTSFVGSLFKMYVTYSILVALGSSFCYYVSILILDEYFSKRLVAANGLALSGAGIGTISLSPLVSFMLDTYKWRNTLRILSGFSLASLLVSSVIFFLVPVPFRIIDYEKFKQKKKQSKLLDWSVFKNKAFILWTIVESLVLFGFYIPYVHLVRHGQDLNIPKNEGGILVGYMAISQTIGKIVFGRLADHPRVNRIYLQQICLLICSVMTTLLPIFTSYGALAAYCWVFGFFDGCFVVLIAIITRDVAGRENMASAFGIMYMFSSTPMMIGPPVAGWMYGITQTYVPAFFMAGALTILAVCLLFLVPLFLPPNVRDEWAIRNGKMAELQTLTGTTTPTSEVTKLSSLYEAEETKSCVSNYCEEFPVTQTSSRSGAQRMMKKKDLNPNHDRSGMSYILDRYFSMPHIVSQNEALLGRVYSKENLYSDEPEVRETNV